MAQGTLSVTSVLVGDDGELVVAFAIAGAPQDDTVPVTLAARGRFSYACVNPAGKVQGKQDVGGDLGTLVWDSVTVEVGVGGTASGSVTLWPFDTTLRCHGHRDPVLTAARWTTAALSASLPGVVAVGIVGVQERFF